MWSSTILQVSVERVKEFSELPSEPPEYIEPRPSASWPSEGAIQCENLVVRYSVRSICVLLQSLLTTRLIAGTAKRATRGHV